MVWAQDIKAIRCPVGTHLFPQLIVSHVLFEQIPDMRQPETTARLLEYTHTTSGDVLQERRSGEDEDFAMIEGFSEVVTRRLSCKY